ncbi:hypothetical protein DFJ66_2767 [Saccharothrix variisporea]|uniref:SMODS-associated and fused to various effectors domain-containing protein n=2 Tax=Saccharothrix variisporea TaxID=543527 RepID=A0A495X9J2_9PSEU|nr:hypothetical protein DFJ66_2767 [Saccharothrix variisporea]
MPLEERNSAENLMLLCHDQHRVIDHQSLWDVFDVETLRAMKRRHEERIRRLTGLDHDNRTTVLRVVGNLHGRPVELTSASVTTALLARDRFPDWVLRGADEFEVDLRAIPGEQSSSPAYWEAARSHLEDRLAHLCTQVRKEVVNHISVFALARIPVLVLLGTLLDKMLRVDIYPKRREGRTVWGWDEIDTPVDFTSVVRRDGGNGAQVAVMFSISGSVDINRLPRPILDTHTIYELRPTTTLPTPELITTQAALDHFARAWRTLLSTIEVDHPDAPAIPIFPAVPPAAAMIIGRHLLRSVHPPLHVYDRVPGLHDYLFTTATTS